MGKIKLKLDSSVHLSIAISQMMEKQLVAILEYCDLFDTREEKSVHEIRRTFKKCRSLLRLIRDPLGYATYYRENTVMRDLQRLLSPARDKSVMCRSLKMLSKDYPDFTQGSWWERVNKKADELKITEYEKIREHGFIDQISKGTVQAIERIKYYQLPDPGFELISKGLYRIYGQGKEMMKETYTADYNPVIIHNFRKKVKYMQYQVSFLSGMFPDVLKATKKSLQKLTDPLGHCHDLHNIRNNLMNLSAGYRYGQSRRDLLCRMLGDEMLQTRNETETMAHQLYAESPEQFTGRLRSYFAQTTEVFTKKQQTD